MATTRRELLGAGASAALGLFPWGDTPPVFAQASPASGTARLQTWDNGDLAHVLPTSSGTLQVRVILFGKIETTSGKTRAADRSGGHQRAPRRW
jgi:hypothetical protein